MLAALNIVEWEMLCVFADITTVFQLAKSRNMLQIVGRMKDAVVEEQGKNIARDIAEMIYAV